MENCCMRNRFLFWFDENKLKFVFGVYLLEISVIFGNDFFYTLF